MQRRLLILSFIEGAAVMAAELCGAKLLAPIFGSSLYVWASVMGITLIALALGYFVGGEITERSKDKLKSLFNVLIAASLLLMLMPVISYYLVPRISYMAFIPAVIISTLSLLFFPIFFLGSTSSLFISIQTNENNHAGKVSGTVYAVSTAGGIIATFLCGFYLMPEIGLNMTLMLFGALLFLFTLIFLKIYKPLQLFLFIGLAYLNLQFEFKKTDLLMDSDSVLGRLVVQDVKAGSKNIRLLKINDIIQTEIDLNSKHSVSNYILLLDSLIPSVTKNENALVLGLGGGLAANLLNEKNYLVKGVEFDQRILNAAEKYFYLNDKIERYCDDARTFINKDNGKYSLILFDVFKAEEQPGHVITKESLIKIKSLMTDSSRMFINWHGYTSEKLGKGTSILNNTLLNSGLKVKMYALSGTENYRNIIFVAAKNENVLSTIDQKYCINEPLVSTELINTDDRPLLEKYNAGANKVWRNNYLRYYQNN